MKSRFMKGAALGVIVTAVTLTASAASAGSGVGAAFNLGKTNSVNASTVLSGATNGPQLRVVNSNTGSAATGIGITTGTHNPPLAINSQTKVRNLNVDLLDGLDSTALQRRITGQCANGTTIQHVDTDGSVSCTAAALVPIHRDVLANESVTDVFAPAGVTVSTDCHVGVGGAASFTFHAGADSGGTLNWMFSRGGATSTVDANGVAMGPDGEFPVTATTTNRVEGQFIWAEASHVITFTLHFLDLSGRCELTGTAEVNAV